MLLQLTRLFLLLCLLCLSSPAWQHLEATHAPAAKTAPHSRLCSVLLMTGAALVFGAVLTQVATVAPWASTAAAGPCWQPHSNRTDTHAAARQHHQQLQEQLQQLKKQHEQQISTLSAVQQAQLQVKAGVQQLQQLYGQLGKTPAADKPQDNDISAQQTASTGGLQQQHWRSTTEQPTGVICTVLRNEARYVPEWVAFHLLMGATKIVIYDDNSTDSLGKAVAAFGDSVVIVDLYQDVTGVPGDGGVHRVHGRQGTYYWQVCSLVL
jgi:hypothetical protein